MKSVRKKHLPEKRKKTSVYILGEPLLVDEFVQQCREHHIIPTTGTKISPHTTIGIELTTIDLVQKRKNVEKLDRALPKTSIILSSSVTVTVTEQASWLRHPQRLVGISAFPTLLGHQLIEFAPSPRTTQESLLQAQDFFIQLGKQISVVQDRIGMVLPRVLCMIINEAYFALQENIASPQDVDTAMKLGTNYPSGPIEWGEKIGLRHVVAVLTALHGDLQDDRYRIAPLLRQMAIVSSP